MIARRCRDIGQTRGNGVELVDGEITKEIQGEVNLPGGHPPDQAKTELIGQSRLFVNDFFEGRRIQFSTDKCAERGNRGLEAWLSRDMRRRHGARHAFGQPMVLEQPPGADEGLVIRARLR